MLIGVWLAGVAIIAIMMFVVIPHGRVRKPKRRSASRQRKDWRRLVARRTGWA